MGRLRAEVDALALVAGQVRVRLGFAGLLLALALARNVGAGEFPPGQIIERVATQHEPAQQYALYLPREYETQEARTWPVLFVLDPRGRAVPGIERFLPAAERHGFVVVSSYQSRSDTWAAVTADALSALLRDAEVRFRIDKRRLYLAGMSGTSHASWRFAQKLGSHAAGVIGVVGGVQENTQGPPGEAEFAYYGITAPADFNYQEMLSLERHLLATGVAHRMAFFDGRHGWPPHEHTNRALDWMQFQAVVRGLAPADGDLIESEFERASSTAETEDEPLRRARRLRDLVRDFSEFREVEEVRSKLERLEASAEYRARVAEEKKLAQREDTYYRRTLAEWLAAMQNRGQRPPTLARSKVMLRLAELLEDSADLDRLARAHSAQRILESLYTTVAFSLPGSFSGIDDLERAARSLEVAAAIYPRRPRAIWRLAEVYAELGRNERAFEALRAATALGRVDLDRLRTDPTWETLREDAAWEQLVASVVEAQAARPHR